MQNIKITNSITVGPQQPCFIIAEIGINHNGSVDLALKLINLAVKAGCDAVKFQKRTPDLCTPPDQRDIMRETPWGRMSYINYRHRIEFGEKEYALIDEFCKERGISWFASCWDEPSVDFIEKFNPALYKAASASLTDIKLLRKKVATGKPLILSTGMSTMDEIFNAIHEIGSANVMLAHATSAYPCPLEELNLKMIPRLQQQFPDIPVGYSGHERGLATTVAAVAMGARFIERHFTLDHNMWGSDQAASLEPMAITKLVWDIRQMEKALGDGIKRVYDSEMGQRQKLRRAKTIELSV